MSIAMPDDQRRSDESVGDAALLSEERPRLREEVEAELAEALVHERSEHDGEDPAGEERGEEGEDAEDLLRDPAAPEPVRADGDVVRVDRRRRDAHTALLARSKRTTTNCATTFVTSEMTMRIAAR